MLKKLTKADVKMKKALNERAAQGTLCYYHCKTECVITGMTVSIEYNLFRG